MKRFKFLKKKGVKKLPKKPGIYCFKERKILYIGKAANIQDRVKNHFQQPGFKESIFLDKVRKIGFIETDSEIEALILEANLIKKCQPKYNVVWKDDKNYFYVGITDEEFPRVFWTHQPKLQTTNYKLQTEFVGPFVDGKALKKTLKILRKIFPFRSCKKIPQRTCLWYHLDRCPAPCLLKLAKSSLLHSSELSARLVKQVKRRSQKNARNLMEILKGKKKKILKGLKKEMKKASDLESFEKAAKTRDKIFALEKIISNAKIFEVQKREIRYSEIEKELKKILKTKRKIKRIEAYDVSNISGRLATGSMVTFINGESAKEFYRKFKIKTPHQNFGGGPNDIAMIKEILSRRFQHPEWGKPDLILIDGGRAQLNAALSCLTSGVKQVEVMAIAKKKNELYIKNQRSILLKSLPREIFNLILQLRDEAHRFAIIYHRKLRQKKMLTGN